MNDRARQEPVFGWPAAVLCGLLWAGALTSLEMSVELGEGMRAVNTLLQLMAVWCATGIAWAGAARLLEPYAPTSLLIVAWVVMAITLSVGQSELISLFKFVPATDLRRFPFETLFVHILWLNAFYGGLYFTGFVGSSRVLRSRRRVARLNRVLSEEAAQLGEARLRALRGQMQPRMLIDVIGALKDRYARDPVQADELVARLIAYLRAATRAPLFGDSTIAAELQLAKCYVELQAALSPDAAGWRVDLAIPAPAHAFPTQSLLPLIENLGREAVVVELSSRPHGDGFAVCVRAIGARGGALQRIAPDMAHRAPAPWRFETSILDNATTWTAIAIPDAQAKPAA